MPTLRRTFWEVPILNKMMKTSLKKNTEHKLFSTVIPRYNAPRYNADLAITRFFTPKFFLPHLLRKGEFTAKSGRWQAPAAVLPPEGWQRGRGPEGPEAKGTATRGPEGPESGQNMRVRGPEGPEDEQS